MAPPPIPSQTGTSPGQPEVVASAAPLRSGLWARANGRIGVLHLVVGPFIASKAIAVLVPMATLWARSTGVGVPPASAFLGPFAQWDGAAYAQIAANGFPTGPLQLGPGTLGYLWARSPGYPLLVHLAMYVIPQTVVAGIVVSAVGELVALIFLAKLVLHERGDEASASFACWALAVFPYAFYLTAVYTESAFLAAAIACLYYMRRGKEGPAALAAGCAMFIHITGVALLPALIVDHLVRRRGRPGRGLLVILASLLSPLLWVAYAWRLTGDPLAYVHAAEGPSFNRVLAWPWTGAYTTWTNFVGGAAGDSFLFGMEILFGVGSLVAILWMAWHWREISPSLTVYALGIWVMATSVIYWLGTPRFEMTAVPIYLALADLTRRHPRARPVLIAASAGWMGFIASLAATGQFVA
jgi:hypothetical protein